MSLRTIQFALIGLLVVVAGWQWQRDLGLRADYAAEGATRAKLAADLAQARAETEGLKQDFAELRTQLDRTRALRAEAEAENRKQTAEFIARTGAVNRIVHDLVHELGGSISAEHGLGQLKREEVLRYKSATEMDMMRAVKLALDPRGLMNPGKLL